jgi:amino acid permease
LKTSGKKKSRVRLSSDPPIPQSPGQRVMSVVSSPSRYLKRQIRPGGMKSSIFSLIVLCLGAGTLSMPYVFYSNGFLFGMFLLIFGASMSFYTGWLIVICCERLNANRYEDIAMYTYGKRASFITSICMLACLIGFVAAYIVLFKNLMPYTLSLLINKELPSIIDNSFWG